MTNWRRVHAPGGTFFFTLVTEGRAPFLTTTPARSLLREVTIECHSGNGRSRSRRWS